MYHFVLKNLEEIWAVYSKKLQIKYKKQKINICYEKEACSEAHNCFKSKVKRI